MKKVMWFSRHDLSAEQLADLERIYGPVEVTQINRTITSAFDLKDEVIAADVVAIVAPLPIQEQFLRLVGPDKPLIFCKNDRVVDPTDNSKVTFTHAGWYRIKEIKTVFEPL